MKFFVKLQHTNWEKTLKLQKTLSKTQLIQKTAYLYGIYVKVWLKNQKNHYEYGKLRIFMDFM